MLVQAIIGSMQGANPCPHITDKSFQNEVIHIDRATQAVMFSSDKNDWETPQRLFDELDRHYHFTLDAAASHTNHKVDRYFTADDDGLAQDWGGRRSSVIRRMGTRRPGSGQRNVLRRQRSQAQPLCC